MGKKHASQYANFGSLHQLESANLKVANKITSYN